MYELVQGENSLTLKEKTFFPHFQPIIDVCSGLIAGYESLARYKNEQGKTVSAGWLFNDPGIPNNKIIEVDRHVRSRALHAIAEKPDSGLIFINVSPARIKQFDKGMTPTSIKLIRELGIDPSRVVIEITEKLGDTAILDRMVKLYREEGLQIAIDDFGVEGSQVDRLIDYNPDFLKIDMDIFKQASKGGPAANVLLSLSDLADRSDCEILCEGVETEEEYHFAIECGASKMQGWLFHPALPDFIDNTSLVDRVFSFQKSYLERKRNRVLVANKANEKVNQILSTIVGCFKQKGFDNLDLPPLFSLGVTRFFACDFNGNQISPNYEITPTHIHEDNTCLGRNWSHRPYFPLLLALNETVESRQIVSKPYFDKSTKALCKTRGFVLNKEEILFIDTAVTDETLFCESS